MSGTNEGGHGTKAIVAAFLANLGIAAAKFVGFAFTRSASMLAEGVHSAADTGNQLLLLFGGRRSRREADADHPFGYGRERYFWAFMVAIVLFTLGATFAIYDGIQKLKHPHTLEKAQWAYGILGVAVLLEGLSFRTALRESRKARPEGVGLWRFIRNAKAPEIPVVILEDLAALTGLLIALAAVVVSEATHNPRWDAYGTIAIGGLLGVVALVLASEMKSLLIGESASDHVQESIAAALEIEPAVMRLIHLRTQHLGPEELLVAAKVEFLHHLTLPEVAEAVDRVEANVRAQVPEAKVMYIEPDVAREFVASPLVAEHTGLSTREWLEETTGQLAAIEDEGEPAEPADDEPAEAPPPLPPLTLAPRHDDDETKLRPIESSELWGSRPSLDADGDEQ
jgi:cation diffusion facilitator family transporter